MRTLPARVQASLRETGARPLSQRTSHRTTISSTCTVGLGQRRMPRSMGGPPPSTTLGSTGTRPGSTMKRAWTFTGMNWAGLVHVFTRTFGTSLNESSLRYYAWPSPQNTWTAPFEERRVARHALKLRPTPVFLDTILHGKTRATLGPCIAVSTPHVGSVRPEPPTTTFGHTVHFLFKSYIRPRRGHEYSHGTGSGQAILEHPRPRRKSPTPRPGPRRHSGPSGSAEARGRRGGLCHRSAQGAMDASGPSGHTPGPRRARGWPRLVVAQGGYPGKLGLSHSKLPLL
jgi:hypothetical protein